MSEQYKDVSAGVLVLYWWIAGAIQKFLKPFDFNKNMKDVFLYLWKCFKNEHIYIPLGLVILASL